MIGLDLLENLPVDPSVVAGVQSPVAMFQDGSWRKEDSCEPLLLGILPTVLFLHCLNDELHGPGHTAYWRTSTGKKIQLEKFTRT